MPRTHATRRRPIRAGIAVTLLLVGAASAQVMREERAENTPINQDYFSADDRFPTTRDLLRIVERYHMGDVILHSLATGDYRAALNDLDYTLHKFPNHPKALLTLNMVAELLDDESIPIPYYEHALELYPRYALTQYQYGTYLLKIGQTAPAVRRLERATELDPDFAEAHGELARAYAAAGDAERSRQAADVARSLGYEGG
jgi:predicted Zn-dependent protease